MNHKKSGFGDENGVPGGSDSYFSPQTGPLPSETADRSDALEIIGMAAAGVSHHLNTLLAGIMGNLNLAMLDAPDSIRPYLEKADQALVRAAAFIDRLLALVRGAELKTEPVDVGKIIDEVADFVRDITDPRFLITVNKGSALGLAMTNSTAFYHALLTICMNARDALHEAAENSPGNRKYCMEIEAKRVNGDAVQLNSSGDFWVAVTVSDSGKGMTEEIQRNIFRPFFTTKKRSRGAGIGLTTARDVIARHGGRIEASGSPGAGSTFTVYLPAAKEEEIPQSRTPAGEIPRGTETILFIDDDELVRGFVKAILERQGYTVLLAAGGREGLELFFRERERIQLLILDMVMPDFSGNEVLNEIRKSGSYPKIILTSGYDRESVLDHLADFKKTAFLVKPFPIRNLTQTVRNALDA